MLFFLDSSIIFYGIFGVLIIPKWLIEVPGHIPIFFGSFLELRQISPNLAPYTPYLSPEYFNEHITNYGNTL